MRPLLLFLSTSALVVGVCGAPANAEETYSWPSASAMTETVAGANLGNIEYTEAGQTFAAWTQTVGANFQPEISRFGVTPKQTWHLDAATSADSDTRVAMAADGSSGLAVYKKSVSGTTRLFWSRWNGSEWSPSAQLASDVAADTDPAIDLRDDGAFGVVVWQATTQTAFAARYDGSGFKPTDTLASSTSGNLSVSVAQGRALAGWTRNPGSGQRLESRLWSGSSWGSPRDVSQNPAGAVTNAGEVHLSEDGSVAAAVWPTQNAGQWSVRSARGNGDTWQTPTTLHNGTYSAVQSVDLALSQDGSRAFATWAGQPGGGMTVFQARYTDGAWPGATVLAGPFTDPSTPTPDVAISDDGGRGLVGYQQRQFAEYRARTQVFLNSGWSGFSSIGNTSSNAASGRVQVGLSRNGTRGAAVLVQQTGGQQYLSISELTVRTPPVAPAAPTVLLAEHLGQTYVYVRWDAPSFDGNAPVSGFTVESDQPNIRCSSETYYTCSATGLTAGIPYRFRVTAYNYYGNSPPSEWSEAVTIPVQPPVPVAPTVTAMSVKQGKRKGPRRKVVVRWTASAPTSSQHIRTKMRGKKWRSWRTAAKPKAVLRLKRGKVYRIGVTATNSAGTSPAKVTRVRVKR